MGRVVRRGRRPDVSRLRDARSRREDRRRCAVIVPSNDGSSTDGRLTSTLAAAPRAAASPRSDATFRSLWALTLLRPASASAASTSSTHASTISNGTSAASRAAARRAVGSVLSLVVRVAGQLQRGGETGIGGGVVVGEGQEPIGEAMAGLSRIRRGARRAARTSGDLPRARRPSRPGSPRDRRRSPRRYPRPGPAVPRTAPRRSGRPSGHGSEDRKRHPRGRLYVRGAVRKWPDRPRARPPTGASRSVPGRGGRGTGAPAPISDAVRRPGRRPPGMAFDRGRAQAMRRARSGTPRCAHPFARQPLGLDAGLRDGRRGQAA